MVLKWRFTALGFYRAYYRIGEFVTRVIIVINKVTILILIFSPS